MEEIHEKNIDITKEDKTLLLVKGSAHDKEYIKKLSNAAIECFYKHDKVKFRYVGAGAGNNAEKALIVARSKIFEESGDVLAYISDFITIDFDGSEKTGIIKETINVRKMFEDDYDFDDDSEENLLLVKGAGQDKTVNKQYVKKLGNAILQVFYKYNKVKLRCVGAGAINNAEKALIIAKGEAFKKGDILACIPNFVVVKFGDEKKTGIVKYVFNVKELKNGKCDLK